MINKKPMRNLVIVFFLILFVECRKNSKPTTQDISEPQVISVPIIDSIKNPVVGLEIGNKAPEISLKDTAGNFIKLSSLKLKIVFIDFWASWCKPCIMENRNLKITYPLFKDTTFKNAIGFEVLSISIDQNRKGWTQKLDVEKYPWKYNVLDSNRVCSSAYNITFIPMNYLVDENGIIIAKNLRGQMVDSTLKTLIKK